jgi:hypothetical protein
MMLYADLQARFSELNLSLPEFPVFEIQLRPIMQDTHWDQQTLNLPTINTDLVNSRYKVIIFLT